MAQVQNYGQWDESRILGGGFRKAIVFLIKKKKTNLSLIAEWIGGIHLLPSIFPYWTKLRSTRPHLHSKANLPSNACCTTYHPLPLLPTHTYLSSAHIYVLTENALGQVDWEGKNTSLISRWFLPATSELLMVLRPTQGGPKGRWWGEIFPCRWKHKTPHLIVFFSWKRRNGIRCSSILRHKQLANSLAND